MKNLISISLLIFSFYGCQYNVPDLSSQIGELTEHKVKAENILSVFSNSCNRNSKSLNKGYLLYGELKAEQHALINQLIGIVRRNNVLSNKEKLKEQILSQTKEVNSSFLKFQSYSENLINQDCKEDHLLPLGAKVSIDLSSLIILIYEELIGKVYKEQAIEELEKLKLEDYRKIVN